jgi:peptidyl-prolyl cis-trans isomerase A (cyclophilin A)
MNRRNLCRTLVFALTFAAISAIAQSAPPADLPDAPGAKAIAEPIPTGPIILIDTSMGRLTCKAFDKQAPIGVANFIGLAEGTKDWTGTSGGPSSTASAFTMASPSTASSPAS